MSDEPHDEIEVETAKHEHRIKTATALLPAWFIPRMMDDEWFFGLGLTSGKIMIITHIEDVHQDASGHLWIDVYLSRDSIGVGPTSNETFVVSKTSRYKCSVAVAHIEYAMELADT